MTWRVNNARKRRKQLHAFARDPVREALGGVIPNPCEWARTKKESPWLHFQSAREAIADSLVYLMNGADAGSTPADMRLITDIVAQYANTHAAQVRPLESGPISFTIASASTQEVRFFPDA